MEKKGHTGLQIGQSVLIRTVTYHYTGRIVAMSAGFITLADAAWIADTGRFSAAFAHGFNADAEIEPYPSNVRVHVAIGAIVDIGEWPHPLPRTVQ